MVRTFLSPITLASLSMLLASACYRAVNNFTSTLLLTLFNQQFAYPGPPGLNAPNDAEWWPTTFRSTSTASASVAAAGPNGQPWIVDGAGNIFRSTIP